MHRDVGSYIISGDFYICLKRVIMIIERGIKKKKTPGKCDRTPQHDSINQNQKKKNPPTHFLTKKKKQIV